MNLVSREGNYFELRVETLDDLWVLSQFIVPGDKVFGKTERKIKVGGEDSTKQAKKLIYVEMETDKVNYDENLLRVGGNILNETEHTAVGQHHSFTYQIGDIVKIEKNEVLKFEERLLENSFESRKSFNLLILLDKDELMAVEFSQNSYNVLFSQSGLGSKKYKHQEIDEEKEKLSIIEDLLSKDYSHIILAGPGHWKEKLSKYIKDQKGVSTLTYSWMDTSSSSIPKLIRKISDSGILQDSQISRENEKVSALLYNIEKGGKYTYGIEEVETAVNMGRIETFLVTTAYIGKRKEEGSYSELSELMRRTEGLGGNLFIINSEHEPGRIIDGLGGMAAILRY